MLCDFLSSYKILFVLNCWINSNKYVFLAISDYFISDNWDYYEILLIFKLFCDKYSEKNLTNYVMKILEFHDIMNQLLTITTDNAKNNDKLCRHLQKMLKKKYCLKSLTRNDLLYDIYHLIYCEQIFFLFKNSNFRC